MEQNATRTWAICLTVIIEDALLITAIFITNFFYIFYPFSIYAFIEIVCFALVANQVKNGSASGKVMRQAKIGIMISCLIIFIGSLVLCAIFMIKETRYIDVAIILIEAYTWLFMLPRIIVLGFASLSNGYVCISRPAH